MLNLMLTRNGKCAALDVQEEPYDRHLPLLDLHLNGEDFTISLDTLRGKLNELEMMTNRP